MEFSLVVGLALAVIVGLIAASLLFFQRAAIHDGSTAGARMASMQTSLVAWNSGQNAYCESGVPISIEQAVATAAPQLSVNMAPLCNATGVSPLTQTNDSSKVNIAVAFTSTNVTATLTFSAQGLGRPLQSIWAMTSASTVPTRAP